LLTYTTKYADSLAAAGFLVIHPSYRNHRGSTYGANPYRIGYARDILNLIPMAQRLAQADGKPVGIWGHSMGGGITLRTLTISNQVKAAVLYGANSGDEAKNWHQWGRRRQRSSYINYPDPATNAQLNAAISPLSHLRYINAALAIHHGAQDSQVPYAWSQELAQKLDMARIPYDFYRYAYQDHNFTGADLTLFNERVITFFRIHLK
jgi:dipeptidyl aminopeptidase/acylaminoacyl peptidase